MHHVDTLHLSFTMQVRSTFDCFTSVVVPEKVFLSEQITKSLPRRSVITNFADIENRGGAGETRAHC